MKYHIFIKTTMLWGLLMSSAFGISYHITAPTPLETTEDGGYVEFLVGLSSYPEPPDENVTIHCHSSDTTEAECSGTASFRFTPAMGDTQIAFRVRGIADGIVDGNISYQITFSTVDDYNDSDVPMVHDPDSSATYTLTNLDNQVDNTPPPNTDKVIISTNKDTTSENGDISLISAVLRQEPTANVILEIESNDTTEGTTSVSSITFTPSNWDIVQKIIITGVDDAEFDGTVAYSILLKPLISVDGYYDGYDASDITLGNKDNEIDTKIRIRALDSSHITESGGAAEYGFSLTKEPTSDVNVSISFPVDSTEFIFSDSYFIFTPANWSIEQILTVTGVDDSEYDGNISQTIYYNYNNNYFVTSFTVENIDNEGPIATFRVENHNSSESGDIAVISIALNSAPTDDVIYTFSSSDSSEGVADNNITFTTANWDTPQNAKIRGIDDAILDFNRTYSVRMDCNSNDARFHIGKDYNDNFIIFYIVNYDNESFVTVESIDSHSSESGDTASFSIVLNHPIEHLIRLNIESNNTKEGIITVPSNKRIEFDQSNWSTPQIVTITGADSTLLNASTEYQIEFAVTTRFDGAPPISPVILRNLHEPSIYGIELNRAEILSPSDANDTNMTILNAEIGTIYHYTITSDSSSMELSGSGRVISANQHVVIENLDQFDDGILTIRLTLTDELNNTGGIATQTVILNVVNDAPKIDTVFHDMTIGNNITLYNLKITLDDSHHDDINLTIESNNTEILQVIQNYSNLVDYATYSNSVNFDLKVAKGKQGSAQITITADDGDKRVSTHFTVKINNNSTTLDFNSIRGTTATIKQPPSNGIVVINGLLITYTPTDEFSGVDIFTISFDDGSGNIVEREVVIIGTPTEHDGNSEAFIFSSIISSAGDIIIDAGSGITTIVICSRVSSESGSIYKAIITTNTSGEITSSIIKVNLTTEAVISTDYTLAEESSYPAGSDIVVYDIDSILSIETKSKVIKPLIIK